MKELVFEAFRLSIAWPRILPEGGGKVSSEGLDFYDRVVDFVGYPTLERIPKESFYWYREFISKQRAGQDAEVAHV